MPVHVINGQDEEDQLKASAYWDVYLPLDSHRFIYMPGSTHQDRPNLMTDHRINLPGGVTLALNNLVIETAHRHIFFHPEHDPRERMIEVEETAQRRSLGHPSGSIISYNAMPPGMSIERRWLERHTWDEPTTDPPAGTSSADYTNVPAGVDEMLKRFEASKERYQDFQPGQ